MAGTRLGQTLKIYIFGTLAAAAIRLLYATIRWEVVAPAGADDDKQVIYAFWHGRMLMLPGHYRTLKNRPPLYMLISQHGDGRLIAFAIKLLGIQSVAGSSTRRGMAATLELVRRLQEGVAIGITPDGPKGPRSVCKRGVVTMALHSGVSIRPVSYSAEDRWILPSWDGMIVPKPFSRGVIVFGDSISPTADKDEESFRIQIEDSLNEITQRADAHWRAV
jgi:lysophospholipid acyltransferase (LPLAT)-like uncharacterized protein